MNHLDNNSPTGKQVETELKPCKWCANGDKPDFLDEDGTLVSITGNDGVLSHAYDDMWWPCLKFGVELHSARLSATSTAPGVDENSVAFTAYNQAIEDAKAAIRGEKVDDPYAAPAFINAIARKCSPHVYAAAQSATGRARAAAEELASLGYLDDDLLVKISDERFAQVVAVISRYVAIPAAEAARELERLTIDGQPHDVEPEVADAVDTLMDVVEDLTEPETLTPPTTHYKNIKHGDPICLGFYKASMDSNEVDCEACLSIIRQRQNMDLHGWLD